MYQWKYNILDSLEIREQQLCSSILILTADDSSISTYSKKKAEIQLLIIWNFLRGVNEFSYSTINALLVRNQQEVI